MAHDQYMTQEAFEHFFEAHAKSLRGEFHRIDDMVDEGFQRMDAEFYLIHHKVDEGLQRIDQKSQHMDQIFQRMDQKFDAVDHKMSQIEARARNYRLTRLHQKIQVITVLDTTSSLKATLKEPDNFPTTIRDFWNLRKKPATMTYLLRFYNLSGWKTWVSCLSDLDRSDSEFENPTSAKSATLEPLSQNSSPPSSSPQQPRTLEDAVDAHPELALQEIAEELGLNYDRIESSVQAYKSYQAKQPLAQAPPKRPTPPILPTENAFKR